MAFHFVTVLMNTYLVTILGMLADNLVEFACDVFTDRQTHTDRQTVAMKTKIPYN